ncbi:RagB/SusD family nutrient uptake outer membrane protein [Chitinophaga vietnamensis]|uniref:RagB/SusD family nutrient uptake outer membrane protein n=1 Tax=Chitinophaga vietnamensis TaxID=2593957 RepID=UPI0011784E15|nr:RagB/SusD family nutrient uptake outer membrane protein [Chitinophaga vietnamensis]
MVKQYKHHIITLVAGFLLSATAACNKDFLELKPEQSTDVKDAVKDLPTMRAAINGVYSQMQSETYYGRTFSLLPDLMADNEYISVINSNRYRNNDQYVVTSNDGNAADTWNQLYNIVANANLMISKGPKIFLPSTAADTTEATSLLAEAYAVRALAFFDLARFYARPYTYTADASSLGIPLVTTTNVDSVQSPVRATIKQTYDQIIGDLSRACDLFVSSKSKFFNSGRINLQSARGLLARAYLYKEDWVRADSVATLVINSKNYTLLANDKLVSDFKNTGNSETMFEVINTATDNRGTNALSYFYSQSGYGDALATDDVYKLYAATDARLGFLTRGRRAGGGENPANIITKYKDVNTFLEAIKVMRFAEIYLIRAEALARQGKEPAALVDLNVIVKRADPAATPVVAAGAQLLQAIQLERRKELAFEGHRLFDLTRSKQSFTKYLTGGKTIAVAASNPKVVLPIPQRELDANPNIRGQQNEGYN